MRYARYPSKYYDPCDLGVLERLTNLGDDFLHPCTHTEKTSIPFPFKLNVI